MCSSDLVIGYAVQQRQREIAIRVAIGASGATIIRMVIGAGAWMIAAGIAVGLVGATAVGRLLAAQLFGIEPFDALTILGVSALLGVAALGATLLPAWRAAATNPILTLNGD